MPDASPISPLRRFRLPLLLIAGVAAVYWGGSTWLVKNAQARVDRVLAGRGLVLTSKSQSWSLWGGVKLNEATLRRLSGDEEILVEIGELHVDLLWKEVWEARKAVTRWLAEDTTLVLHDDEGRVTLQGFSTDFHVQKGKVDVARIETHNGPVSISLKGQILTTPPSAKSAGEFQLRLRSLRSTLNTLQFTSGSGPFVITGDFTVDRRSSPMIWTATLRGEGKDVIWRELPMRQALVTGRVNQDGMDLTCDLQLLKGAALVKLEREGWQPGPMNMSGTLTDSAGRSDEFQASYLGSTRTLTMENLSGSADLIELVSTFPPLAKRVPPALTVKTFPDIVAQDLVYPLGQEADTPDWTLASLKLRSPADIVIKVRGHPLAVDHLTGEVSRQDSLWKFDDLQGHLLDGRFHLDAASYDGETLKKAKVALTSLRLALLTPWLGEVSDDLADSDLSLTYNGAICNQPVHSTGSGTLLLTDAPVVHIPLIEQAYTLFPKVLPDRGRAGVGSFQVSYSMSEGVAAIDPFKARSNSVTVTATGTVDLVKRRVDGKARANLRGIVGRITVPLSHIFTDMEVSGPLDDIRVTPQGPIGGVKNLLKGTSKAATSGAKLSGKVLTEGLTLPFEALGMFGDG